MKWKLVSLLLIVLFYIAAGINHFRNPGTYIPLIPPYFKWPVEINILSGIAEIVLGIGLAFNATRKLAAYGVILLLLAFVPAHIYMIQAGGCFPKPSLCAPVWVMWARLLIFQPLLIWWAWNLRNVQR